jgi:hypothetical protein
MLVVMVLTMLSPGCALIKDGVRGARTDIRDCVDDARERMRNWKCAEGTWKQIRTTDPHAYSPDYAQGFKEGFAEYLYSGKEDAPALAPAHYRRFSYQTPQGYRAIEDWFAGYRSGVAAAIETGYRRLVTAQVSAPLATVSLEPVSAKEKGPASPPESILTPPKRVTPPPPEKQAKPHDVEKASPAGPRDPGADPPAQEPIPPARFGTPRTRESDAAPVGEEVIAPPPAIEVEVVPPTEEVPTMPRLGGLQPPTVVPD